MSVVLILPDLMFCLLEAGLSLCCRMLHHHPSRGSGWQLFTGVQSLGPAQCQTHHGWGVSISAAIEAATWPVICMDQPSEGAMYTAWEAVALSIIPILVFREWSIVPMFFIKSFIDCSSTSALAVGWGGVDCLFTVFPLFFTAGAAALLTLDFGGIVTIRREHVEILESLN